MLLRPSPTLMVTAGWLGPARMPQVMSQAKPRPQERRRLKSNGLTAKRRLALASWPVHGSRARGERTIEVANARIGGGWSGERTANGSVGPAQKIVGTTG